MILYRRNRVAGGTYFFAVTLRDRSSDMLTRHIDLLRGAFRSVRAERPFAIDAIVILPDHLHAIWTLPEGDAIIPGAGGRSNRVSPVNCEHRTHLDLRRSRRMPVMATLILGK